MDMLDPLMTSWLASQAPAGIEAKLGWEKGLKGIVEDKINTCQM